MSSPDKKRRRKAWRERRCAARKRGRHGAERSDSPAWVKIRHARRSDLEFFEAQSDTKCTRCGKRISLLRTSGDFGDSQPEGLLIEGAPYCWDCMGRTLETIAAMHS